MSSDNLAKIIEKLCENVPDEVLTPLVYKTACEVVGSSARYGSPIEELFAYALALRLECMEDVDGSVHLFAPQGSGISFEEMLAAMGRMDFEKSFRSLTAPQVRIGKYKVDFLLSYRRRSETEDKLYHVAIECDGHEFHEKTEEQARHDKARDRWLQSQDIKVMRFTGSEIWEDPHACVASIYKPLAWEILSGEIRYLASRKNTPLAGSVDTTPSALVGVEQKGQDVVECERIEVGAE